MYKKTDIKGKTFCQKRIKSQSLVLLILIVIICNYFFFQIITLIISKPSDAPEKQN